MLSDRFWHLRLKPISNRVPYYFFAILTHGFYTRKHSLPTEEQNNGEIEETFEYFLKKLGILCKKD